MLSEPGVEALDETVRALREWQYDGAPVQLHPGDLGWYWRFGAAATAAAVRTWSRDGQVLAVGLLDGSRLLRLAIAPRAGDDQELAHQLVADVTRPERGVLPQGEVCVEARFGEQDTAVAAVTVWSAGPGRPGLLEPVGVHRDHRGQGYGTAITVAAAAALRTLGSSSATVCTRSSNVGAVATYRSAGFQELPAVRDLRRSA